MKADRADKKAKHWWNFLALHSKEEFFFFDSFGFTGLTEFIMNDTKKKILIGSSINLKISKCLIMN